MKTLQNNSVVCAKYVLNYSQISTKDPEQRTHPLGSGEGFIQVYFSRATAIYEITTKNPKNPEEIEFSDLRERVKDIRSFFVSKKKKQGTPETRGTIYFIDEDIIPESPIYSEISSDAMSWTEKYKPNDMKRIIGQQGEKSNMSKLKQWLERWYRNQQPKYRKKIKRPSPWTKNYDGAFYKAALLSGPPGVGKTTTATLVSKELGFDVVEFNASDTRSKKLLHEEVSHLLSTNTIAEFAAGKGITDKKRVLLMDEIDDMAEDKDRGGMQELISLIKNSSIPIICTCNDRSYQMVRPLVNQCFDLRFQKPPLEQIRDAMMSICFKERLSITPNDLSEIINSADCDIRQTLNNLSVWSAANKNLFLEVAQKEFKAAKKGYDTGSLGCGSEQKDTNLSDKSRIFFYYSMGPLFVQENYLNVTLNCKEEEVMKRVAQASDAISMGDLMDSKIRGSDNWSLLEIQAMYSTVLPGYYMAGHVPNRISFPGWLEKNSSANKRKRMLSELHMHTRLSTSGSKMALNLDYLVYLRNAIIHPLQKYGTEGVHQAMEIMKSYNLSREDLTNLLELCQWKDAKNPYIYVEASVKAAFTRAYHKEAPLLPYALGKISKERRNIAKLEIMEDYEYVEESDTEETDDIAADANIKVKVKGENKTKKESSEASTSRAKGGPKEGKAKGESKTKKESSEVSTSRAKGGPKEGKAKGESKTKKESSEASTSRAKGGPKEGKAKGESKTKKESSEASTSRAKGGPKEGKAKGESKTKESSEASTSRAKGGPKEDKAKGESKTKKESSEASTSRAKGGPKEGKAKGECKTKGEVRKGQ
ncbi:hypothetical protein NQ318_005747 [Aromia moschata]|uniref:AAA+ ATPase domain-containing protein n=1 Tax=Aromia moschata TaxID=1265417 RepID=A0AAV8YU53_9CUCU|nr:hypothetical protein NQ318_005747 [Aromia moschata]